MVAKSLEKCCKLDEHFVARILWEEIFGKILPKI